MAPTDDAGGERVIDGELLAAASELLVQAAALARRGAVGADDPPTLAEIERRHILRVLDQVGGNRRRCAEILGIDRKTLHRKLARYRNGEDQ